MALINQLKLSIEPSKIPHSLISFSENDVEYYSLSNISHLLSVFKYLLSFSSYNENIFKLLIDSIKEIITERKKYEQLTIDCENKTDSFLYELQCELYSCYKTIEYKNEEINNDDISNIVTKLHKLHELYENYNTVKTEEVLEDNSMNINPIHNSNDCDLGIEYHTDNYQSIAGENNMNEINELKEDIFQGYSSTKPIEKIKMSNLVINISKPPTQNTINELETVLKQRPKPKQTIVYSNGYVECDDKKKIKEEKTIPNIPQLPKTFPNFLNKANNGKIDEIENTEEELTSHT